MKGYSASDIISIIKETSLLPLREISEDQIMKIKKEEIRPVCYSDFTKVISETVPSLSEKEKLMFRKFQESQLKMWRISYYFLP